MVTGSAVISDTYDTVNLDLDTVQRTNNNVEYDNTGAVKLEMLCGSEEQTEQIETAGERPTTG